MTYSRVKSNFNNDKSIHDVKSYILIIGICNTNYVPVQPCKIRHCKHLKMSFGNV